MKKVISFAIAVLIGIAASFAQGPPSSQGYHSKEPAKLQSSRKMQNFDKKKHSHLRKSKHGKS